MFNTEWTNYKVEKKQNSTAKLNWLVYNVGSYGEIEPRCLIVHVLYGLGKGYLATLIPVGLMHSLYKKLHAQDLITGQQNCNCCRFDGSATTTR